LEIAGARLCAFVQIMPADFSLRGATDVSRSARFHMVIMLAVAGVSNTGPGKGALAGVEEDEEKSATATPRVYLDLSGTYTAIPANSFAIGFVIRSR
jgi:hypothetical protein